MPAAAGDRVERRAIDPFGLTWKAKGHIRNQANDERPGSRPLAIAQGSRRLSSNYTHSLILESHGSPCLGHQQKIALVKWFGASNGALIQLLVLAPGGGTNDSSDGAKT